MSSIAYKSSTTKGASEVIVKTRLEVSTMQTTEYVRRPSV